MANKNLLITALLFTSIFMYGCKNDDSPLYSLPSEINETIPGAETGELITVTEDAIRHNYSSKSIKPINQEVDLNNLADGIYPAEFYPDTISDVKNGFSADFKIYTEDYYSVEDIESLEEEMSIVIGGEEIVIDSIRFSPATIFINGDDETESLKLFLDEEKNLYRCIGEDDYTTYTLHGKVTLPISSNILFNDGSDFSTFPDVTVVPPYDFIAYLSGCAYKYFNQYNTTVRISNGTVVTITRIYTP